MKFSTQVRVQNIVSTHVPYLYHMTHVQNLNSILTKGLFPHGNQFQHVDISNQEVNSRRSVSEPIHHRPIHSYVPFYFNPRNAMLYKTTKDHGQSIVILGYDNCLINHALITDGNAANDCTRFGHVDILPSLNWSEIHSNSWYPDNERKRKMMAEILIASPVATKHLKRIFCQTMLVKIKTELQIKKHFPNINIDVLFEPKLFF